jgi:hypothetical protein
VPATVQPGGSYVIKADAADNVGIAEVEFRVGGERVVADTEAPYEFTLDVPTPLTAGNVITLTAVARDLSGAVATAWPSRTVMRRFSEASAMVAPPVQAPPQQPPAGYPTQPYPPQQPPGQPYLSQMPPGQRYPSQQPPGQPNPFQQQPSQPYPPQQQPSQQYPPEQYPPER